MFQVNQDATDQHHTKFSLSQVCQMPAYAVPAPTAQSNQSNSLTPKSRPRSKKKPRRWRPRVHTNLDHRDPTVNNFAHFKLEQGPKGLGVVCVKSTTSSFVLVGQYPNCHKKCNTNSNMCLGIDPSNKHGLGDSVSVDPKRSNGSFAPNLDKYLACRINEPSEFQSVEGTRFHPNCGWRVGENSKTKEIWQEFWTLRKIHKDEELTVDYGTAYPRAYATNKVVDEELYEHLHDRHQHRLNRLGTNKVNRKKTHRVRKSSHKNKLPRKVDCQDPTKLLGLSKSLTWLALNECKASSK
jgi:hypothetical protein